MTPSAPQKRGTPTRTRSRVAKLFPGDTIEYSLTAAVKHPRHGEWWVKTGGSTKIRDGETADEAKERLRTFVHTALEESVNEVLT